MTQWPEDRTLSLEPRTVNLSLKEIRELLEAGPKPAPSRRAHAAVPSSAPLKRTDNVELLSVGVGGEDESE